MTDPAEDFTYDRSRTGWEDRARTQEYPQEDGSVITIYGVPEDRLRPESERQRCGYYTSSADGRQAWGDHRVTEQGTTCEQVECTVNHHPDILPGWAEPYEDFHDRPGAQPIAAVLWGWNGGGMLNGRVGDTLAWVAAHIALDALRDAGYDVVKRENAEE